ncbi:MAG: hypothetical protein ACI9MR_000061 [Myxococcota bacterium]|jgi:hypothetical protein
MNKYRLIDRAPAHTLASYDPSPEEMQAQFQQWQNWKEIFEDALIDMGDRLKHDGRVLAPDDVVRDGPFTEAKEVIGGYSIVGCKTHEEALDIARACPERLVPGTL